MAQQPDTVFLKNLLESHPDLFNHILNHPTHNEVQILYTQIDRDENNLSGASQQASLVHKLQSGTP